MKKICYILVFLILMNLVPYTAFANENTIRDQIFEKGTFIGFYTNLCDDALDILSSSINDTKKEEKLQALFDTYDLNGKAMESPKTFIDINSYNKEKKWLDMITEGLIDSIAMKIEDSYFANKNAIDRMDTIDAVLQFYKLDEEISKYEVMRLDDEFSNVNIPQYLSNIIDEYNTKKELAFSISNLVQGIEAAKKYNHIKTILDEFLIANHLDTFIESSELVELIKGTKNNDRRIKLLFDKINRKKTDQYFKERIENIADHIIEEIDYNIYYRCADKINRILRDNHIGYYSDLDRAVVNVAQYMDHGYKTKKEAIQEEIFSKLKLSYSEKELHTILDEIISTLEFETDNEVDYKEISTRYSDEIYEVFLDIIYDYRISDIKQYVIPVDIAYAYYNYEELGYETVVESIEDHLKVNLKKSALDETITKIIQESQYNLPVIVAEVTTALNNKNGYEKYLDTEKINEIIHSKPENVDAIILDLILDGIIASRQEDIIRFTEEMDKLTNQGDKYKEIDIENILREHGLDFLVDAEEMIEIYKDHNDKAAPLKEELHDVLLKELDSSGRNIEDLDRIISILDTMELNNDEDLDYIIHKSLALSGLNTYVIQNDIKDAYTFPSKYGYSDRRSGIVEIIKKGIYEKISSEIKDILNKDLNKKEIEKEIKIILKRNHLDSNISFTEIKQKYLIQ